MSVDAARLDDPDLWPEAIINVGPLGCLPYLSGRQVRLDDRVGRLGPDLSAVIDGWNQLLGGGMTADRFGVQWRGAGLKRPGVVAHLAWPRLRSRVGLGIDPPLAHALVDRLLGFERTPAESRLQVSPVEWGVLTFLAASGLERLEHAPGPIGPWDLTIDRVGPDPFDVAKLGSIVTMRWRVRIGGTTGSARLWVPESLLIPWLDDEAEGPRDRFPRSSGRSPGISAVPSLFEDLTSDWRAEAGSITLTIGSLAEELKVGRLLLIDGSPIAGTTLSPEGEVALVQRTRSGLSRFLARVEPGSSGDRLVVVSSMEHQPTFRKPFMADSARIDPDRPAEAPHPDGSPLESSDVSVTLTVELGRVSFPLRRLANLQPGDVVELARHGREPVDLSSNGRLVARGELVQVDTELGVRVTQVFF